MSRKIACMSHRKKAHTPDDSREDDICFTARSSHSHASLFQEQDLMMRVTYGDDGLMLLARGLAPDDDAR